MWQWQWLGSGIRLALSDILLQLDWEAAPFPLSSDKQGNFSPAFILRLWLRFLFNLLMPEEGSLATLRILVSSGQTRPLWTAENNVMPYAAPLEQGWPKSSGTHPPPPTLRQLSPEPLRSHFSPRPLRHARVKSAGFLIHHNPLSNCVVSLFLSTILEEKGFPSKTKGLKMNFALTRRHGLPLNRRLWDLMKVNCEYSSFSPPLYISGLFHSLLRIMPFLINAQRHDLDSRGNSIMCAQVHVWEVSACFFNVAFYLNECSRAPKKMCTFILQADMLSRKAPYTTLHVHLLAICQLF